MLLPFMFLPRPSILTSTVVASSVAAGLLFGLATGGAMLLIAAANQ